MEYDWLNHVAEKNEKIRYIFMLMYVTVFLLSLSMEVIDVD